MAGSSSYPGALDDFSALSPTNLGDNDSTGRNHGERHDDLEAAVEAVQAELGVNPAGTAATVVARLDALPTLSDDTPLAPGTAAAGTALSASRADHVHDEQDLSGYVSSSVVTNAGDLIVASGSAVVDNLAAGTNEHRLVADSGETLGLKYVADTTNYAVAAKGDLLVGTAADTLTNVGVGSNGQVLTADSGETAGVAWADAAGGGKVLQVVSATATAHFSTTSTSYVDWTGMSVSITPSSATSKILVIANFYGGMNASLSVGRLKLVRDSTDLGIGTGGSSANMNHLFTSSSDDRITNPGAVTYLDSPSSTSALTYKLQVSVSGNTLYLNRWGLNADQGCSSTITVMEIGA